MDKHVTLSINGRPVTVPEDTILAVALAQAGQTQFRRSVKGEPRSPLCAMGTCFECRVTVNGKPHQRSCQTLCCEGMEVTTDV
jgi:predicted molibdopterin-dependent oxidoreductase YjgC